MSADHDSKYRPVLIEAARQRTAVFVRTVLARGDREVPACLTGYCIGLAERTAAFASGDRVIVVTLASIREISPLPTVPIELATVTT